jgi:predicted phage-related endonuclease
MKTLVFENKDDWMEARRGKITGSRLKDIIVKRGTGFKIGVYEVIAERLGLSTAWEDPMERGSRLEPEAIERFEREMGKKVDASLVIWVRDDNDGIAVSPDGVIGKTEAVEAKCLSSAQHIKAWLTKKIPDEYYEQGVQYFIVNDKLKKLHFAFYDPRIPSKDFFVLTMERVDVQETVDEWLEKQRKALEYVENEVKKLAF